MNTTFELDRPAPSLASWSRTARPVRLGRRATLDTRDDRPQDASRAPGRDRLDDVLFGSSAIVLMLAPVIAVLAT